MRSFETLYHRYAKAMYNTSLRIVNNEADAEDVLQESFMAAFRLEHFDYSSSFGAWLKRIVINKSIDVLRKRKVVVFEPDENIDAADEEPVREDDIPMKIERIRKGISQLPNGYRTVLSLHLVEGYDYDEIAGILGITATTVRTQFHRARQKLLNLLKKEVEHG